MKDNTNGYETAVNFNWDLITSLPHSLALLARLLQLSLRPALPAAVLPLQSVQLRHAGPGVLQPVPGHLQNLLRGVTAPLVRLPGGHLQW